MVWDIIALVGLTLATFGLYSVYPPIAWISVGVVLVWAGIAGYLQKPKP